LTRNFGCGTTFYTTANIAHNGVANSTALKLTHTHHTGFNDIYSVRKIPVSEISQQKLIKGPIDFQNVQTASAKKQYSLQQCCQTSILVK